MRRRPLVHPDDVEDPLLEVLRQLFADHRDDDLIAREHDVPDPFAPDEIVERGHDLLHVLQLDVLDVPLIPRLRPAAHLVVLRVRSRDFELALAASGAEDEDARLGGVGQHRGVARILVEHACERVQMRPIAQDDQPLERHLELQRLEEAGRAAGKERESLRGRLQFIAEIPPEPLHVGVETRALGRGGRPCLQPLRELVAENDVERAPARVVGAGVEVQAQHRHPGRFPRRQSVEVVVKHRQAAMQGRCLGRTRPAARLRSLAGQPRGILPRDPGSFRDGPAGPVGPPLNQAA